MGKEAQVSIGSQIEQLTLDRRIRNAQRLTSEFSKTLEPMLARLKNPNHTSARDLHDRLNTQATRDAAIMMGKGVPPIAVFERGQYTFKIINWKVIDPRFRTLALSVEDDKNPPELVALIDKRDPKSGLNGSIEYHRVINFKNKFKVVKVANTIGAVEKTEEVLRKLRHPLLSSLPYIFKKAAHEVTL